MVEDPCSTHRQLCRPRWQVELARRNDPHLYVLLIASPVECRYAGCSCIDNMWQTGLYLILCVTFWYYPGTSPVLGVDMTPAHARNLNGILTLHALFRSPSHGELLEGASTGLMLGRHDMSLRESVSPVRRRTHPYTYALYIRTFSLDFSLTA